MNYKDVRKKLLLESGLAVALLAVLGVGVWYLGTVSDDYDKKKSLEQSQEVAINGQVDALKAKYDKIQKSADVFNEVSQRMANDSLNISRQALRKKFNQYKAQYYLADAHFTMTALQEVKEKIARKTNVVVTSDVVLDFSALSDEDIYGFLQSLQQDLPGAVKMSGITISRTNKVTDDQLRAIADKGQAQMVKATVKFTWFGIKSLIVAPPAGAAPANPNDPSANASPPAP